MKTAQLCRNLFFLPEIFFRQFQFLPLFCPLSGPICCKPPYCTHNLNRKISVWPHSFVDSSARSAKRRCRNGVNAVEYKMLFPSTIKCRVTIIPFSGTWEWTRYGTGISTEYVISFYCPFWTPPILWVGLRHQSHCTIGGFLMLSSPLPLTLFSPA